MENINIVISGKCVDKFEDDEAIGGFSKYAEITNK